MVAMTLEAGAWVGPRNLYSHCIVDVAASGNVKVACNKRFGPTAVVPENGNENHISRCDKCVKVTDSAPMPVSEIPAIGAAAKKAAVKPLDDSLSVTREEIAETESTHLVSLPGQLTDYIIKHWADAPVSRFLENAERIKAGRGMSARVSLTDVQVSLIRSILDRLSVTDDKSVPFTVKSGAKRTLDKLPVVAAEPVPQVAEQVKAEPVSAPESNASKDAADAHHKEAVRAAKTNKEEARNKAATSSLVKCTVHGRARVKPVEGTDSDGIKGQCPECRTFTDLSAKGFIGTHNVGNAPSPASPALSERTVPPVATGNTHGATSDAEKKVAATVKAISNAIDKGKEAGIPTASHAPTGEGAAPMLDGVATLPRGKMGTAGVRFDSEITDTATVGGRYGWLTSEEYGTLISGEGGKSRKRNYWRRVAKNKAHARNIAADRFSGKRGNGGRAH